MLSLLSDPQYILLLMTLRMIVKIMMTTLNFPSTGAIYQSIIYSWVYYLQYCWYIKNVKFVIKRILCNNYSRERFLKILFWIHCDSSSIWEIISLFSYKKILIPSNISPSPFSCVLYTAFCHFYLFTAL